MSHADELKGRAAALIDQLRAVGVELYLDGGALSFRAPRGALQADHKAQIQSLRDEIIAILSGGREEAPEGDAPLSFAQRRLWFLHELDPDSPQYNIGSMSRARAHLDIEVFKGAMEELFQRHPVFRTRFVSEDGTPRQKIMAKPAIEISVVQRQDVPEADRARIAQSAAEEFLREPLDLATGQVAAFRVLLFSPDDFVLMMSMHHIISDGMSIDIIQREITELYQARIEGRLFNLPPLSRTYADFAKEEVARAESDGFHESAEFWRTTLADAPHLLELPTDRPRAPVASGKGARYTATIDAEIVDRLRKIARAEGVTIFMTLLSVWQTLLARLSGQTDIVVGTPVSTREDEDFEKVIGCFVNNIVLRGDLSGTPSFSEQLKRTKTAVLSAFRHMAFPFDMIVETVKPPRTAAYTPIFQAFFALLSATVSADDELDMNETGATRFDISLELAFVEDGSLKASYEYAVDLFERATIERMHRLFVLLLQAAADSSEASLMGVPLVTDAAGDLPCMNGGGPTLEYDPDASVPALIRECADPESTAIRFRDEEISYRQLNARIDALAEQLAKKGAGPGERVAVILPRSIDLVVALAAVLRTGAAYIPIQPDHPKNRIALILEDSEALCGIVVEQTADLLGELDAFRLDAVSWPDDPLPFDRPIDPQAPAYLIYTSGSTGKPKGVLVSHRNLVSFLAAMRVTPGIAGGERLLAVTTPSFDIAGLEMWLPLTSGACVVLAQEEDVIDGPALANLLTKYDIDMLQATPTTWRLLLESGWEGKSDLIALCGGEAMPPDLAEALCDHVGELWNMYGPTEATIWSAIHRVSPEDWAAGRIPIGGPIANTRLYVLEASGALAPIGAPGELLIAGDGVALGYWNLPALTAEKFVEVDIAGRTERAYRTGDLARWRADEGLDFLGRRDQQVKVRGFRIELGEIEAAIAAHPAIRQAFVTVSENVGGATLVAYVVYEPGENPTTSELRRFLRASLPDYMMPSIYVGVDRVPLSPNGKVDRSALPDPYKGGRRARADNEPLKPGMEESIAAVWREYLETEAVGPGDNFYELGGHSLMSLRVAAAIEQRTGYRTDPRAMFFRTLRELAADAEQAAQEAAE